MTPPRITTLAADPVHTRLGVRRSGLHGRLLDELGHALVAGEFAVAGSLTPNTLCERYGVSRSVAREALRVLEAKGMVSARQSVGTAARPRADWNLLDPDVIYWRLRGPDMGTQMRELLGLRAAIEPHAAGQAALCATDRQRRELAAYAELLSRAHRDQDTNAFAEADVRLHMTLLQAGGNPMITQLASAVVEALNARREFLWPDHLSDVAIAEHLALVASVTQGDADGAERHARALIAEATTTITQALNF